ncbi:MAG: MBL fold metallo-hydrolase, partial [Bdellovibrionales bacterium]|nr:MBL fold metallo-hydrolase [Bdellovibrionales bacterium]
MDWSNDLLVTFWGTRGSVPTPGRATEKYGGNTSCLEVQHKGKRLILDAGTGIRNLGVELSARKEKGSDLDLTLLISHTHWDHIQGLPFFTPAYLPSTKLTIWGNTSREHELAQILGGQMIEEYFPVNMTMLGADIEFKVLPE